MNKITNKKNPRVEVIGTYLRSRMRNFQDGYTVFDILTEEGSVLTCTGNTLLPNAKILIKVTGEWVNSSYGKQLQHCTIEELLSDKKSIEEYVKKVPYVGNALAEKIAENLTINLQDLPRQKDPIELLVRQTGIPEKTAQSVVRYISENQIKTALFQMLSRFGAPYATTEKIFSVYGAQSIQELLRDPYLIGSKFGLDFPACDMIAKGSGIRLEDNPKRIAAAAEAILRSATNNGDCCFPLSDIAKYTRKRLGAKEKQSSPSASSNILVASSILANSDTLTVDRDYVYARNIYWQEERSAYAIRRLVRSGIKTDCDPEELCDYAEELYGVTYAEQQREAFQAFQHGGLCVLTGGPGTGKTTVVKGLLAAYEKLYPDNIIKLCAPTGRASQRMKEATGREACTVHRLIEYTPFGDTFTCRNEASPIEADFIVVDESSMISIDMAELLFSAISSGTMVLLVGDTAQLPSVGPGNVLADIIRSGIVPVFALTKTHRQGAGSPIIENAKRISAGEHHLMQNKDFSIIECDEDSIGAAVRNHYVQYHRASDPFAIQILSTTKKDPKNGCNMLNKLMQKEVNTEKKGGIHYGETVFYVGDKIMMTRNNYEIGYFNGDVGLILNTSSSEITVNINGEVIHVPTANLEDMSLAYASTIHKSQGSEYDVVIVVLPSHPITMLQRNILYTAITSAKKRVILITSEQTIFHCVNTVTASQRKTLLCERLQHTKGGIYKKTKKE